jgi:simple sugar transport system ATP-binding protein
VAAGALFPIAPIDAIHHGIQVIYQDFSIFPNLTVMENLAFNTELAAGRKLVNWRRLRDIARQAVGMIDFDVDLDAPLGSLSVAEKQMVAISRALLSDAKLIIMDEPTTALTKKEVAALFKIILDLKRGHRHAVL